MELVGKKKLNKKKIIIQSNSHTFKSFVSNFSSNNSLFFVDRKKKLIGKKKSAENFLRTEKTLLIYTDLFLPHNLQKIAVFPRNLFQNVFEFDNISFLNCLVEENIDQIRKKIMQKFFLRREIKKDVHEKRSSILVLISNQTNFFQLIIIISSLLREIKKKKGLFKKPFLYQESYSIRFGKMIKPADFRRNFSDGHEDFLQINCAFNKKNIYFGKVLNTDFIFLTPLSLRTFDVRDFIRTKSLPFYILIDNFHNILLQNVENINMIIAKFFFGETKTSLKTKVNFLEKKHKKFLISNFLFPNFIFFNHIDLKKDSKGDPGKRYGNLFCWNFFFKCKKDTQEFNNRFLIIRKSLGKFFFKRKKRILICCKDYFQYIFIRNGLWKNYREKKKFLIFLHEYLSPPEISKRKILIKNNHSVIILMTERFYFFHRYKVSGVNTVFFFSNILNFEFFYEISKNQKEKKKIPILRILKHQELVDF